MEQQPIVTLLCGVYVERCVFPIPINRNASLFELQEKIFEKQRYFERFGFAEGNLTLYLARKDGAWLRNGPQVHDLLHGGEVDTGFPMLYTGMMLDDEDCLGPNFTPGDNREVHVLVQLPPGALGAASEEDTDQDWTEEWKLEVRKSQVALHKLPLLGELADHIASDLSVKVPVIERIYARCVKKSNNRADPEVLKKIFRISDSKPCIGFVEDVANLVLRPVAPAGQTETSYIFHWDGLIRNTLDYIGIGESDRDSNRSASTGANRPNYLYIVDDVCVFRGEEKAPPDEIEKPREELSRKLVWSYGDTPYLFGYAAVGYRAKLYAITRGHSQVITVELGKYDLKDVNGRLRLLLAILNIAPLLEGVAKICPDTVRGEFKVLKRDHGVRVFLEPSRVIKSFPTALFQSAKDHVETVYEVLRDHAVPNVDRLEDVDASRNRFIFEPRGQERVPDSLEELFHALIHVLQALVKLHAAGWMHRDIRWPNVLRRRDAENSWFLIDFMDAAQSPQSSPSGGHLRQGEHAPEIFQEGVHTTAVDVWSIGRLIETCPPEVKREWYDLKGDRSQFLELLKHSIPSRRPSAAAALARLRQLEQAYWKGKRTKEHAEAVSNATRSGRAKKPRQK